MKAISGEWYISRNRVCLYSLSLMGRCFCF